MHFMKRTFSTSKRITLYGFPLSQPTRSVLLLCNATNIEYDFKIIDALKGENRKPQFLAIHPAGLLPAITDEGLGTLGDKRMKIFGHAS